MEIRRIKFRVWTGEQMVSPDYIDRKGVAHWKQDSIHTACENLLQFTGLLDKNGKEIYEGDVILNPLATEPEDKGWLVVWKNYGFRLKLIYDGEDIFYEPFLDLTERFQVIGNIYETPDLLI
jgi:uncharacterized phage protein (TIGR01671 family)